MKNFKKRTIALVLASVVTVAGSFASERFKNSLMGLSFEASDKGALSMVVQTKINHSGSFTPVKKDANTFVLVLPEFDNKAPTPDLTKSPNIESVNIRTMPYTNNGNGYTKITIKTNNIQRLPVEHRLYIEQKDFATQARERREARMQAQRAEQARIEKEQARQEIIERQNRLRQLEEEQEQRLEKERVQQQETQNLQEENKQEVLEKEIENTQAEVNNEAVGSDEFDIKGETNESFLLIMGVLLVIFVSAFCYVKAKEKMVELSGESLNVDLKEEEEKKNKKNKAEKKLNTIKNTIKTLDSTYAKSATLQKRNEYTSPKIVQEKPQKPAEEVNVVDLDVLFQEQIQTKKEEPIEEKEDENKALEDFLSGFSFDEEYGEIEEEQELYDTKLFEEVINGKYKFSADDIKCINNLMQSEIKDETLKNINTYLVSNPIKTKSKEKILEDMVTTLAVSQNIIFTRQDVDALRKLMNFEIDNDFITDLRTNPQRTKEVTKELAKPKEKVKKPTDMLSLKVNSELPDLSEALKQQGNRKVVSNHKPETVYFSEGYEVSTLSIGSNLPDLSKEINNKEAYLSKPSAEVDIVDSSYEEKTLSISFDIPDLAEALKNPQNFEAKEKEEVVVDEKALLENISKIQFKPFDEGTQSYEVLNDLNDFYAEEDDENIVTLSREEIAAEFQELYSEKIEFITPENEEKNTDITQEDAKENTISRKPVRKSIEVVKNTEEVEQEQICVLNNESYNVISSVKFSENMGCHLVKNSNGYAVIGYVGDVLTKIKTFETLKSEKLSARVSEKLDNIDRYIVRIGVNKFILDVDKENIIFVMDLC